MAAFVHFGEISLRVSTPCVFSSQLVLPRPLMVASLNHWGRMVAVLLRW